MERAKKRPKERPEEWGPSDNCGGAGAGKNVVEIKTFIPKVASSLSEG